MPKPPRYYGLKQLIKDHGHNPTTSIDGVNWLWNLKYNFGIYHESLAHQSFFCKHAPHQVRNEPSNPKVVHLSMHHINHHVLKLLTLESHYNLLLAFDGWNWKIEDEMKLNGWIWHSKMNFDYDGMWHVSLYILLTFGWTETN